jgi:predicted permease
MSPLVFVKLFAIFAVVAIGWAVARSGRLGGGDPSRVISGAAFYIFVPALLFRTSARTDFARLDVRIVVAFFVPTIVVLLVVYATLRFARAARAPEPAAPSVRAITASFGNAVQIGIPLAAALYGESGLALHVTLVSLHALILLTILTALVEVDLAQARRRTDAGAGHLVDTLATTARNTVIHPVVLPVLAGLAWNFSGLALPTIADEILATLGQAVVPVCLVLIGVSLAHYGVRGALRSAALLAALKLVVHPLAVLAFARFGLGLTGVPLAIVVMMAAVPVGSNALIFAQRYQTLPAETSTAIVASTLAFVASAPLWLAVLHAIA